MGFFEEMNAPDDEWAKEAFGESVVGFVESVFEDSRGLFFEIMRIVRGFGVDGFDMERER